MDWSPEKDDNQDTRMNVTFPGTSSDIKSNKYDLKCAVKLPVAENECEWIANNIIDFHKQISMLYDTIADYCTPESCPKMTAGRFEYVWESLPPYACVYISYLLEWVQEQLDDEDIFPLSAEKNFPSDYMQICKTISKRLIRVFAHIYHHHLKEVRDFKEEPHMNTNFKHFYYFVLEFGLVTHDALEPLKEYIQKLDEASNIIKESSRLHHAPRQALGL